MATTKIQLQSGVATANTPKLQLVGSFNEPTTPEECSGEHVITVSELPTENIDEGAIYKVANQYYQNIEGVWEELIYEKDIPVPTTEEITVTPTKETQEITPKNADYISKATVNPIPDEYIIPSGTVNINTNGEHDIAGKKTAVVNVPIPDGYVVPSGEVSITENGEHNVSGKAKAVVNVPSIIDVTELPTSDIDTSKTYRMNGKLYRYEGKKPDVITDLTGTTWYLPNGAWTVSAGYGTYWCNGYYNYGGSDWAFSTIALGYSRYAGENTAQMNVICVYSSGTDYMHPNNNGYDLILKFTSGGDVTNTSLISWLEANGELTSGGEVYEWVEYLAPEGSVTITENSTVDVTDKAEVIVNVPDNPKPIEVSTEARMAVELATAEVGSIFKYTGETTDTYENGAYYVVESNVTLISFTIDGTTYQAEEGMTWVEWCESDYNTDGYYILDNTVFTSNYSHIINGISTTDTIEDNEAYSLETNPYP